MKHGFQTVLAVFLLTALIACPQTTQNVSSPPPPSPPPSMITPVGTNVGSPVTQAIGATGGTVTVGTIKVSAPAGAFSSANITLQPITDTLNGSGQGIAISSDATWGKYLTVTFPIEPTDESPDGLGLAVQQPDGSWLSLEPVKVDRVAGTISAGLPAVTTQSLNSSNLKAQGGLDLKRVIKFLGFYMKPESATVKVKESVTFVPYARVLERSKDCKKTPAQPPLPGWDELEPLPPKCWKGVTNVYPFTNEKAGFSRMWTVNGIEGGDSSVGKISPNSPSGATYTAPDTQPSPNTVRVGFLSVNDAEFRGAPIEPASVTVVDGGYKVVGDFTSVGYPACYLAVGIADVSDHLEFTLAETGSTIGYLYLIANIQNQVSENKKFRASQYAAGGTVTQNSISEVLNASKGHAEFTGTDTLTVTVDGGSWTGGCTLKYPDLTFNYPPGETVPSFASFQLNLNEFNNNTQTVNAADPSGFGNWKFTITRQ